MTTYLQCLTVQRIHLQLECHFSCRFGRGITVQSNGRAYLLLGASLDPACHDAWFLHRQRQAYNIIAARKLNKWTFFQVKVPLTVQFPDVT